MLPDDERALKCPRAGDFEWSQERKSLRVVIGTCAISAAASDALFGMLREPTGEWLYVDLENRPHGPPGSSN